MEKKVVHTRVSDALYKKISSRAKARRVTISNLIRNLVEDSLELSGDVLDLVDLKLKSSLRKSDAVLGYQTINLAKNTTCDLCGKQVKKGTTANLGFLEDTSRKLVVCDNCRKENE